jgi:BirA family biotin operon repressor/biotin-[acetyl-CoA-carboxylase] ligase
VTTIVRYDEVDSTQRVARDLALGGAPSGTIVVAKRQTAGRGRLGRTWISPDSDEASGESAALTFSMILHPACPASDAPKLTLGAAVGILQGLDELGVRARVKWPNDVVLLHDGPQGRIGPFRKIAGILVEAVRMTSTLDLAILGVGVNLRPPRDGWPEELALTAGSLADVGFRGTADEVLDALRIGIADGLMHALVEFPGVLAQLRARSATLGRRVAVEGGTVGEARAILDDGALLVIDDDSKEHVVRAADVWVA